jgi:hypothetical protein
MRSLSIQARYTTKDIEKGPWQAKSFKPMLHDHSLFFDDDDRVYMIYGAGNLRLVELKEDLSGLKEGGFNQVVITNAHSVASANVGSAGRGFATAQGEREVLPVQHLLAARRDAHGDDSSRG